MVRNQDPALVCIGTSRTSDWPLVPSRVMATPRVRAGCPRSDPQLTGSMMPIMQWLHMGDHQRPGLTAAPPAGCPPAPPAMASSDHAGLDLSNDLLVLPSLIS
jgi:hypothetical protein